ncbi:MAG: transcriptional repressor [Nitrospirae bacterium]|jgi:Fur family ferric uptake transcriptional regulator|nr:transcriptional repressor [Nitrospirota bacterium]
MIDKNKGKKDFTNFLREHGQRLTNERSVVLNRILSCTGHFDPDSLYLQIRQTGLKVSRASVYRTLNLLHKSGFISIVRKTEKGTIYECVYGIKHHDHMHCNECGKVIEFYSEELEKLQEKICEKQGFKGQSHTLEIRGYCAKCKKNMK